MLGPSVERGTTLVPRHRKEIIVTVQHRRIVVIDDHQIVGLGVSHALNSQGVDVPVAWYPTVEEATWQPKDVAVLDLRLKDGSTPEDNIAVIGAVDVPVIIYTSGDDPHLVRRAIQAGALSIIRKATPPEQLVNAIQAASEGQIFPGIDWAAALDADDDFVQTHLTPSEAQVLTRYAEGAASDAVARALGMSKSTVETYVTRIRNKYRSVGRPAENRVDLFRRAAEDGLISYYER